MKERPLPRLARPLFLVPVALVAAIAGTAVSLPAAGSVDLEGLSTTSFGAAALRTAEVHVPTGGHSTKVLLDGRTVGHASKGTVTVSLSGLTDGDHTLVAQVDRGFPRGTARTTRHLTVDTTAPTLSVVVPTAPVKIKDKVTVTGTAEQGAQVTADGGTLTQQGDHFTIAYSAPPAGAKVVAVDAAGNRTEKDVTVRTSYPTTSGPCT
jgi:hypothetical protein